MRVALEIIEGPEVGRRIRVSAKELRTIGRTDRADVALPLDRKLSELHCAVETDGKVCRVRDLGSTNGTRVNGELIGEQVLADGDKLALGETVLRVHVEGGASRDDVVALKVAAAAAIPAAAIAGAALARKKLKYTAEDCQSGIRLFRGEAAEIKPALVVDLLARKVPVYLMVDWHKLGLSPPEGLPPHFLFDWIPPEAARANSPWIVEYAAYPESFKLIEEGWGEDGLVCVFSKQDPQEVRAHLRRAAQGGSGSVVGICWPSVLAPLLTYSRSDDTKEMTAGLEAIIVEFPDLPETWQIFAPANFAAVLAESGFEEQKTAEQPAT